MWFEYVARGLSMWLSRPSPRLLSQKLLMFSGRSGAGISPVHSGQRAAVHRFCMGKVERMQIQYEAPGVEPQGRRADPSPDKDHVDVTINTA